MKNISLVLFCLIGLNSCGVQEEVINRQFQKKNKVLYTDKIINKHVVDIKSKLNHYGIDENTLNKINEITFYFSDAEEDFNKNNEKAAAFCVYDTKEVVLHTKVWEQIKYNSKTILLAHEIGHCAWKLQHIETPLEIMFKSFVDIYSYGEKHWKFFADTICKKENLKCNI